MTIDTHQGFKELVAAGLPERQAEAVVALFSKGIEGKVVTPDQFSRAMAEIDMRFTELEARFDQKLAELEARLVNRFITVVGLSTALIAVLMTILSFVT